MMWEKTFAWITENDFAQTQEIPKNVPQKQTSASSSAKKKGDEWNPDEMTKRVAATMPGADDLTVWAHRFVETSLVPLFMEGLSVDVVRGYDAHTWNETAKDSVHIKCRIHPNSHATLPCGTHLE